MPQELAASWIGDDGSLVADDGVVKACLREVRAHATEHAPGDDDHVDARGPCARDGAARMGAKDGVLRDQGAVEVDREGGDPHREPFRQFECYGTVPPVDVTTNAATLEISCAESWLLNEGMTPLPFVMRAVASR